MLLRHKFGLLAILYASSILLTLVIAILCIVVYFESAFREAHTLLLRQDEVEHLRTLVHARFALRAAQAWSPEVAAAAAELDREFVAVAARLDSALSQSPQADAWQRVKQTHAAIRLLDATADSASLAAPAVPADPALSGSSADFAALESALVHIRQSLSDSGNARVLAAAGTQRRVVAILTVNAVVAAGLCALGLVLVYRWVMQPVTALRLATRRIAEGDFTPRLEVRTRDELGRLAQEVNHTCALITAMQARLAEQERLAGAGEMVSRLAHNIRNPLAGLRGLAEETLQRHTSDDQTRECQRRIIETVDRFEKWLRDLQQSVSPMTLRPQRLDVRAWIDNVVTVVRPMADRRDVTLRVDTDAAVPTAVFDSMHMEQALVALLTNAVQATAAKGQVTIRVQRCDASPVFWELRVEDTGEGIALELHEKVFQPYFSTKPDGHGLGLAMVAKIIKLHGGRIELQSVPGQGSRFCVLLPLPGLEEAEGPPSSANAGLDVKAPPALNAGA